MTRKTIGLDDAYGLETPGDSVRLYADWAESYDEGFAREMDYRLPYAVADLFLDRAGPDDAPVLDVGAGTGLVAERLAGRPVDALDISDEMLAVAAAKGLYRRTIAGDLTATLPIVDAGYGGVVSAGTFTHGHVGPEALPELLRIARPGALFALSINAAVFEAAGFRAALDALEGRIAGLTLPETRIYGDRARPDHAGDTALVALFRKA